MQFSRKVDSGLFLLIELLKNPKGIRSLREIADANNMSFYFLQKVALELRKSGLINSQRGKMGGYKIIKSPDKVTLREIIEVLEGPVAVMHCLSKNSCGPVCERENSCHAKTGLQFINNTIIDSLEKTTLLNFL